MGVLRSPAGDLVGEVGHPDAVGPAGLDAGLDRGADVVDVDVDVPEAFAADDDEAVAEPGQRLLEHRDRGVLGVEEIHHLVGRAVGREVGAVARVSGERHRDAVARRDRCGRWAAAGRDGLGRVEDDAQAPPAGVDDAGVGQRLELGGRPGQRLAGGRGGRGEDVAGAGPGERRARAIAASEAARATVRIVPSTGSPTAA